jgi:hypothetical protein
LGEATWVKPEPLAAIDQPFVTVMLGPVEPEMAVGLYHISYEELAEKMQLTPVTVIALAPACTLKVMVLEPLLSVYGLERVYDCAWMQTAEPRSNSKDARRSNFVIIFAVFKVRQKKPNPPEEDDIPPNRL